MHVNAHVINNKLHTMYRLSKKIEYALLALQYLAYRNGQKVSAKEMAERLHLSFEFLAKTLQSLYRSGFVKSQQGVRGGYFLTRNAEDISLGEVIYKLEDNVGVVECFTNGNGECVREDYCTIKHPMKIIQKKIDDIFYSTTIAELVQDNIHKLELEFQSKN